MGRKTGIVGAVVILLISIGLFVKNEHAESHAFDALVVPSLVHAGDATGVSRTQAVVKIENNSSQVVTVQKVAAGCGCATVKGVFPVEIGEGKSVDIPIMLEAPPIGGKVKSSLAILVKSSGNSESLKKTSVVGWFSRRGSPLFFKETMNLGKRSTDFTFSFFLEGKKSDLDVVQLKGSGVTFRKGDKPEIVFSGNKLGAIYRQEFEVEVTQVESRSFCDLVVEASGGTDKSRIYWKGPSAAQFDPKALIFHSGEHAKKLKVWSKNHKYEILAPRGIKISSDDGNGGNGYKNYTVEVDRKSLERIKVHPISFKAIGDQLLGEVKIIVIE